MCSVMCLCESVCVCVCVCLGCDIHVGERREMGEEECRKKDQGIDFGMALVNFPKHMVFPTSVQA